ncbi:hypothetical protein CLOBOL_06333 [Enterocloster bolteae ATCC BAA-613]|uniref:Uncharacterized protein n=1 Tax=Enterocloster bolteae (strain ATCC BAA-613 / DSM 15670 / CCUG 46953 / JCM 12243 / WAL 16351) TaxID=411902 RepID=A8S2J9_ENTBW|nr:hypothetical protein CLOBOL_06333 [Enterocloster bolteae ATCC BAA-613]
MPIPIIYTRGQSGMEINVPKVYQAYLWKSIQKRIITQI